MESLFELWSKKTPSYNSTYSELFAKYALKGNAEKSEEILKTKGLLFYSQYEFFMYSFFLGVYSNNRIKVNAPEDGVANFGHQIEYWGKKGRDPLRKDFSNLQKYMFAILVTYSDIDFIALEKEESKEAINKNVSTLLTLMEEFANGGLQIIKEKCEDEPNYFYRSNLTPTRLILEYAKSFNSKSGD